MKGCLNVLRMLTCPTKDRKRDARVHGMSMESTRQRGRQCFD